MAMSLDILAGGDHTQARSFISLDHKAKAGVESVTGQGRSHHRMAHIAAACQKTGKLSEKVAIAGVRFL